MIRRFLMRLAAPWKVPENPPEPEAPAGRIVLELACLPESTLFAVAEALGSAMISTQDTEASVLLHGMAARATEAAVRRAERRVVRTAESMLQVRVWRAPDNDG